MSLLEPITATRFSRELGDFVGVVAEHQRLVGPVVPLR